MKNKLYGLYRRHRFAASMIAIVISFVLSAGGLVVANGETLEPNDTHVVSLYMDGKSYDVPTRSKTVEEFLSKAKISLSGDDLVEPSTDTPIEVDLFRIRISRARPYIVKDAGKEVSTLSAHTTPRLIAESAGIALRPADTVTFEPIDTIQPTEIGRVVSVVRSKVINVSLYGSLQQISTNTNTVQGLLDELRISPANDDEISPVPATTLVDGASVFINRKGIKVVTEEIVIPQQTEYVTDNDLTLGTTAVRDPGKPGKRIVTYQIITENDQEVGRSEISSVVVEQPLTKVVARGKAAGQIGAEKIELMRAAGISPEEYAAADFIIGHESGWCATKWQGQWGQCPSFYEEKYPGAENVRTLGYGLCQSTPAIKMSSAGADWRTNPITQLKWCSSYAAGRYGSWTAAYEFWVTNRWW